MASMSPQPDKSGRKAGVRRMKKHNLGIDMTPMVDLGFLLIAFFVMTAELARPVAVDLQMPKGDIESMPLRESETLTVLLGDNDEVFYYPGDWEKAFGGNLVSRTNFSIQEGLGKIIRARQRLLDGAGISVEGRNGLMLLIKPTGQTNYQSIMKALDETLINNIRKYAIVKPRKEELDYLERANQEE